MSEGLGVHKVEQAAPLWDIHRQDIYYQFRKATEYQAYIRSHYDPRLPRILKEELRLKESIFNLWGMTRAKIYKRYHRGKKYYAKLFELDNPRYTPTTLDLLEYYRILAWFLEEYGITKVDNEEYKIDSTHAILKGFVKK